MFAAGRILRHNRRLSSQTAGGILGVPARPRRKEKRKFRCYLPFMWSALAMTFLGITVIVTGTAMCIAGWYLGHFDSDELVVTGSPNVTDAGDSLSSVFGLSVEIPPARGLAYAGPVVMSFGCFAVVFACVVVCETRDRVLETMDDRVRRGLPARPPGGIDADFYALVVEFRKRRVEKQRRRRKLLRQDDDEDRSVDCAATSPLQPTPSTADLLSPSTINDFVEDQADDAQPTSDQRLPTVRLEGPDDMADVASCDGVEVPATLRGLKPTFPDSHLSRSMNVESWSASAGGKQTERHTVSNLSLLWKPTSTQTAANGSFLFDNDVFSIVADAPQVSAGSVSLTSLPTTVEDQSRVSTSSQLSFPLFAPISSMTQTPTLPYVRLDVSTPAQPTYLVHTASVHAIADRSPDVVPQPDVTSFEFPPTDFRYSCNNTTSGSDDVTTASGKCNCDTYVDVESILVTGDGDSTSVSNVSDNNVHANDVQRLDAVELEERIHGEGSRSSGGLTASSAAAVDDVLPADVVSQTKRRHCNRNVDQKQSPVADILASSHEQTEKCPDWSSRSPNDGGPSRKRSRGSVVHPQRQVDSSLVEVDDGSVPLSRLADFGFPGADVSQSSNTWSLSVNPCLSPVDHEAATGASLYRSPGHDARNAVCPRRRRTNGIRHLLTVHRRRRRPDRVDYVTSGSVSQASKLPRRNFAADAAAAHHSASELETFPCPMSSVEENISRLPRGDDETSPLIWHRRRTAMTSTTTNSPQPLYRLTTKDSFQSTV